MQEVIDGSLSRWRCVSIDDSGNVLGVVAHPEVLVRYRPESGDVVSRPLRGVVSRISRWGRRVFVCGDGLREVDAESLEERHVMGGHVVDVIGRPMGGDAWVVERNGLTLRDGDTWVCKARLEVPFGVDKAVASSDGSILALIGFGKILVVAAGSPLK